MRRAWFAAVLASGCGQDGPATSAAATSGSTSTDDADTTGSSAASDVDDARPDATSSGDTSTQTTDFTSEGSSSTGAPELHPCDAIGLPPVFPGAAWAELDPSRARLDPAAVDAFVGATGDDAGVLVRCGYLVRTWGSESAELEWASASKPVWSTLLLFAIHEGLLASADDLVVEFGWPLVGADAEMTFRHLADQTSGYGLPEDPGQAWGYNDYAIKLYALTLFERVFGDDANAVAAAPQRFGALELQDGDLFGDVSGAPRVVTTPRDFARIGWLWANAGTWNGTELIPRTLFEAHARVDVPADMPRTAGGDVDDYLGLGTAGGGADQTALGPGVYGFNWWFNDDGMLWPDAPPDAFQANGHWNGEVLVVIPSLGIVAAWRGSGADPDAFADPMNAILAELVAATD